MNIEKAEQTYLKLEQHLKAFEKENNVLLGIKEGTLSVVDTVPGDNRKKEYPIGCWVVNSIGSYMIKANYQE